MRDLANNIDLKVAFAPKAAVTNNTPQVSTVLDRKGYESVVLAMVTGAGVTSPDPTFTTLLEESDAADMSNANAVADSDLNGTEALASFGPASVCRKLGYVGSKRYLRATVTPSGNGGNLFLGGMWVLGGSRLRPIANPPA